jgi:hypothetical protein
VVRASAQCKGCSPGFNPIVLLLYTVGFLWDGVGSHDELFSTENYVSLAVYKYLQNIIYRTKENAIELCRIVSTVHKICFLKNGVLIIIQCRPCL